MLQRLRVALLAVAVAGAASSFQRAPRREHVAWVGEVLTQMQSIKPGMTREALLRVFTTEGGLSNGLRRTFVSRECPLFKVDVEFQAVGRAPRDRDGRVTLVEDGRDIILKLSRPYLEFTIAD